jgi:2-keto-4-pentenoate hydratase/2-oxohepta-3-ene-1,7-dioic acid hydratase in catechol pathway
VHWFELHEAHPEGGRTPPPYPSIFLKVRTSLASYDEDVLVPKLAQDDQCDYEGELSIVIGKTGKNIKGEGVRLCDRLCFSSNNVSSRK